MANPEEFKVEPSAKTDEGAGKRLYEGTYIKRSGDTDSQPFVKVRPDERRAPIGDQPTTGAAGQPTAKASDQPVTKTPVPPLQNGGAADWRLPTPDVRTPSATWHDPSKTQFHGRKEDISRTQGGTYFQARPGFVGTSENPAPSTLYGRPGVIGPTIDPLKGLSGGRIEVSPPSRTEAPVRPVYVPAETHQRTMPVDAGGRQVGPVIITDSNSVRGRPAEPIKSPGYLIGQQLDNNAKAQDKPAEGDWGISSVYLAGFVGGCLIGVKRGGVRGAAAGALIGLAAAFGAKRLFE